MTSGESYILVGYYLSDGVLESVVGQDTYVAGDGTGINAWDAQIPVRSWDGRKVDYNKSGLSKSTGSKKEALNVKVALVTYSSGTGTVTEVPGITVGGVKIDKKAIKAASVEAASTEVKRTGKYGNVAIATDAEYNLIDEHATLGDVPSFTVSVKTKGTDAKSYKKSITDKLKSQQFYFGIEQKAVTVYNSLIYKAITPLLSDEDSTIRTIDKDGNTVYTTPSANDIKEMEKTIAKELEGGYVKADVSEYGFDNNDEGYDFTISKFNGKKANIVHNVYTWNGKKAGTAAIALKAGKDYSFESGSLAGEDVAVLTFPAGGNYVYAESGETYDLSTFGYKYAFRVSPTDKKLFRYGVYAGSNSGFVYSAE